MNLEGIDEFITRDLQDSAKTQFLENSYTEVLRNCLRDVKGAQKTGYLTERSDNARNSGYYDRIQKSNYPKHSLFDESSLPSYESELDELFSQKLESSSQASLVLIPSNRLMHEINYSDKVMASLKAERDEFMRKYLAERDINTQKDEQIQQLKYQLEDLRKGFYSVNEELLGKKNELSLTKNELQQLNGELSQQKDALSLKTYELLQANKELSSTKEGKNHIQNNHLEFIPIRIYEDQQNLLKACQHENEALKRDTTQLKIRNKELEASMRLEQGKIKNQVLELRTFCERLREKLSKYKFLYDESLKVCACGAVESVTNSWSVNGAVLVKHANVTKSNIPNAQEKRNVSQSIPPQKPIPENSGNPLHNLRLDKATQTENDSHQLPMHEHTCVPCSKSLKSTREDQGSLRGKFNWQSS